MGPVYYVGGKDPVIGPKTGNIYISHAVYDVCFLTTFSPQGIFTYIVIKCVILIF